MQEQMNKAMASLSETVGEDVPTIDEVRDKIEQRYAKAKGMAELQGSTVEGRMLEVEQAAQNTEAQARLAADPGAARPGPHRHRHRRSHRCRGAGARRRPPHPLRSKPPASSPPPRRSPSS